MEGVSEGGGDAHNRPGPPTAQGDPEREKPILSIYASPEKLCTPRSRKQPGTAPAQTPWSWDPKTLFWVEKIEKKNKKNNFFSPPPPKQPGFQVAAIYDLFNTPCVDKIYTEFVAPKCVAVVFPLHIILAVVSSNATVPFCNPFCCLSPGPCTPSGYGLHWEFGLPY